MLCGTHTMGRQIEIELREELFTLSENHTRRRGCVFLTNLSLLFDAPSLNYDSYDYDDSYDSTAND